MKVMNLEHVFRNVIPRRLAEMQHITDVPAVFIFICTRLNGVTAQDKIMFFIQDVLITVTCTLQQYIMLNYIRCLKYNKGA